MERYHKELIRINYMGLARGLRPEIDNVAKFLYSNKILSDHMTEDVVYQPNPSSKAYKLLDIIVTRGPKAFEALYEASKDSELWEVADILVPNRKPHGPGESGIQESGSVNRTSFADEEGPPLPEEWPSQDHMDNVENFRLKVKTVDPENARMLDKFNNIRQNVYRMKHETRGFALIINNVNFAYEKKFPTRTGSDMDAKGLNCVLEQLGFNVMVKDDKNKEEMKEALREQCVKDHTDCDCFILAIFSHGSHRKVFGTDGSVSPEQEYENYIELSDIEEQISDVKSLAGKPKLLFIQACQGGETNTAIVEEPSSTLESPAALGVKERGPQPQNRDEDMEQDDIALNSLGPEDATDTPEPVTYVPTQNIGRGQDVFMALATTGKYKSYRNTVFGSWFIQALIYVLANYAHLLDITKVMLKVQQLVNKAKSKKGEMQVCLMSSTLIKEFFFFPGLTDESV